MVKKTFTFGQWGRQGLAPRNHVADEWLHDTIAGPLASGCRHHLGALTQSDPDAIETHEPEESRDRANKRPTCGTGSSQGKRWKAWRDVRGRFGKVDEEPHGETDGHYHVHGE